MLFRSEPPLGVNFKAFDIKFLRTWSILNLSMNTVSLSISDEIEREGQGLGFSLITRPTVSSPSLLEKDMVTPPSLACAENILTQSDIKESTGTSCLCTTSIPLSILSKQRRSLRISSVVLHATFTSSRISLLSASFGSLLL